MVEFDSGGRETGRLYALLDGHGSTRSLLRGLGHDIRNAVQLIALAEPGSLLDDFAENLDHSVEQLVEVAHLLSWLARAGEDERPEPVALGDALRVLDRLQRHQRAQPQIPMRILEHPALPAVRAVERDLVQALLALVTNAKEAMGEDTEGLITLRAEPEGDDVLVSIEDDGPGIPPEMAERAFEPWVTTRGAPSLGLGLTAARWLISSAGGTVRLVPGATGCRAEVRLARFDAG